MVRARPPDLLGVQQKRRGQLDELRFGEPEQQQESQRGHDVFLLEEGHEGLQKTAKDVADLLLGLRNIARGLGQGKPVVDTEQDEHSGEHVERERPGQRDVAGSGFEQGLRRRVELGGQSWMTAMKGRSQLASV